MRIKWSTGSIALSFHTFREKLLAGLIWNGLSAVSLQGTNLLASALLARLLGLEQFGAYSLVIATVSMLANFAQGGCGFVATKLVAENLVSDPTRIASVLRLCTLLTGLTGTGVSLLLIAFAPAFSTHILDHPELQDEVRIAALSIFFQVAITYQTGALQGFGAFKDISRASAASGITNIACLYVGAWLDGLQGALIGFTIACAARAFICGISLKVVQARHSLPKSAPIRRDDVQLLWRLALPAGLAGLVTVPALWLVNLSISKLPEGLLLVGIFAIATQVRQASLQIPTLLNTVTFSVLSRAKGAGSRLEFRSIFITNLIANMLFGCAISLVLIAFAENILSLWRAYTPESALIIKILAASIVPELLAMSAYQLVQSSGRMWTSLVQIAIPRDAAYLCVALYFLPIYGLPAAAAAYFQAQLVGLCSTLITVWQIRLKAPQDAHPAHP